MHPQTNYFAPTRPVRAGAAGLPPQRQPDNKRKRIVLNVLSIATALYAVYEALGVSNYLDVAGLSNDDAAMLFESTAWKLFFDPVGFAILTSLFAASFVIHAISKSMSDYSYGTTRTGLIATGVAFVLSLFRVSILFPLLFGSLGMANNSLENGSDVRTPMAEEFVLEAAQLIQYRDASGVRITTAFTNNSTDHWQSATLAITYLDAGGAACGRFEQVEDYIAPGQQRSMTTKFLTAAIYYDDPSCVPATATSELVSIDVDSRSQIILTDYERPPALVFTSLMPFEEPGIGGGVVKLSVAGTVAPESLEALGMLEEGNRLPVGFEVIDQQGLRLDWCFEPENIAPDGTFMTDNFHSPVDAGEFRSAVVVPGEC